MARGCNCHRVRLTLSELLRSGLDDNGKTPQTFEQELCLLCRHDDCCPDFAVEHLLDIGRELSDNVSPGTQHGDHSRDTVQSASDMGDHTARRRGVRGSGIVVRSRRGNDARNAVAIIAGKGAQISYGVSHHGSSRSRLEDPDQVPGATASAPESWLSRRAG